MSSGLLVPPARPQTFLWEDHLNPEDYAFATYRVRAACGGEQAALGMAMEQSAATLAIRGYVTPDMLEEWTIRVRAVRPLSDSVLGDAVARYSLHTEVYQRGGADDAATRTFDIELAVPLRLLGGKAAQLLNIIIGELPRLGFLTAFRLTDIRLPAAFGPGPAFGREGILDLLGARSGPLLCRSMRPAVGLDLSTMARLNRDVLVGGFHLVKDDELIHFTDLAHFRRHVAAMVSARDEAIQATGEKKLYLANLICEPDELRARWEAACESGVDGVLVAPFIQGWGILSALAREARMPLLAHNTCGELITRHAAWGIDDAVVCRLMRHLGADWFVTPGPFASGGEEPLASGALLRAATAPEAGLRAMMPIIQGGKHPEGLPDYRRAAGGGDFMLIVASWVDGHPDGLTAAARTFREALAG